VALVITDVSEERIAFIIRVTRIGELGKTLAVTSKPHLLVGANVVPSSPILVTIADKDDTLLRNVGYYKSHTMQEPGRWHYAYSFIP
jgi:hypothetical protein